VKLETTPALVQMLRAYAEAFAAHPPALLAHFPDNASLAADSTSVRFPFAADSDRGLGVVLLAAALHRPGSQSAAAGWGSEAAALVAGLFEAYGTDVFRLNRLPFDPLRDRVAGLAPLMEAADRARVPGIARSVCDFFFRTGSLTDWLATAPDWEQRAGELSQEIYWMGARSRTRTKARLFFWLVCNIPGYGARPEVREAAGRFRWALGDGHMRLLFDIVKPPRGASLGGVEGRLDLFADLARRVFPDAPWRLYLPLDSYLKPDGKGSYRCRAVQGGCRPCPLAALCPAAKHFLGTERTGR